MASSFAHALQKEISAGNITTNFMGVAVGDSWIDPMFVFFITRYHSAPNL